MGDRGTYIRYIKHVAFDMGFVPGDVEYYCDGRLVKTATIPKWLEYYLKQQ